MKKVNLALLFFVLVSCVKAQTFSFDEFINETDSTRRIELAIVGSSFYRKNNLDSLIVLANFLSQNVKKEQFSRNMAFSFRYKGSYYIRTGNIPKGIKFLKAAREIFLCRNMNILLSETENELGNAFFLIGNYNSSSRFYFASIVHGSITSDKTAGYNGMIGFGKTVSAIGDTAKGQLFVQKYLERSLRDDKFEAASDACGFLGMIAGLRGKVELMSAYYRRANIYASRSDSKTHLANALTNRAIDYFYHDKQDSAIFLFEQSLKIRQEIGATRPIVESYYNLAVLNIEMSDYAEAEKYAQKGEDLSRISGLKSWQLDCLVLLLEIANHNKNETEAAQISVEIERIKEELKMMSKLDDKVLEIAADFTSLNRKPRKETFFWEGIAFVLLMIACVFLLFKERHLA